jgi:hypothetical protein
LGSSAPAASTTITPNTAARARPRPGARGTRSVSFPSHRRDASGKVIVGVFIVENAAEGEAIGTAQNSNAQIFIVIKLHNLFIV